MCVCVCVCVFSNLILTAQQPPEVSSSIACAQMNKVNVLKMVTFPRSPSGEASLFDSQTSAFLPLFC